MLSFTEENYLKTMFNLSQETGEISVNDLSKALDIKMPTVNSMVKKLDAKGLVSYQSYKPLKLTEEGITTALLIIRKHRLTEMFLVNKMGFGWEEVHEVAEQIEHIHSPKFFAKMDEMLDFPTVDPHGSPIPDAMGNMDWKFYEALSNFKVGDKVRLAAVSNSSQEFLKYLTSKGLKLKSIIEILSKEEFDESLTVQFNGETTVLSAKATEKLLVEKI
ncbi:metal-dependent transcriptional regulator [Moheibacter stercoris]|uniref:Transcriptional regulator MntR n=1 Tax=Moheibacter stercoris TaxID=1628251 RepID=A0ABV2LXY8_9FLAO